MKDCFGRTIPSDFRIEFRRDVLAESLWQYGEDELAERALSFSEAELYEVQLLAVWHHVNDPEPERGPRLTNPRIQARAAIEFVEGRPRDTARRRRRTRPQEQSFYGPYLASLTSGGPVPSTAAEQGHYEPEERLERPM